MTFVIYRYNLKVIGIFSKDEPITKEYLESKGFELTVKNIGVVYKLKIVAIYGCTAHKCYYYYFPKSHCDVENILHEISTLEVRYYDEHYRTITESFVINIPKTQFDMDVVIKQCINIVKDKCKDAQKVITKPIK